MQPTKITLICLILPLCALIIGGCGQKRGLYLPEQNSATQAGAVAQPSAVADENSVGAPTNESDEAPAQAVERNQ